MKEPCPTCGYLRETFQGKDGTGGFVPPVTDKAPGKAFAVVKIMPDGTSHVVAGNFSTRYYHAGHSAEAYSDASDLNAAHSAAVKEKVREALEGAAKAVCIHCHSGRPVLNIHGRIVHDTSDGDGISREECLAAEILRLAGPEGE